MQYRAYFFGNLYISSIQHGIQAAHVVTRMFMKYKDDDSQRLKVLNDWGDNHITKILLCGGYQSELQKIYKKFQDLDVILQLPYAKFHEEEVALNGALTSVGIILPEDIFDFENMYLIDENQYGMDNPYTRACFEMHQMISQYRLAN